MDKLWAPWRMEYIQDTRVKTEEGECIFCHLAKQTPDDKSLVLARGKESYVVMNRFPYNCGHLLIVPYQHTANLSDLSKEGQQETIWLLDKSLQILEECMKATGFNCGLNLGKNAGGGILDHFHWHVVPRWQGDTNFLPVLAQAKPMPEYLSETYKKLEKGFQNLGEVR
ncbi:MAG: hypothetical protein A2W61_00910 [Deltaproteobacteria bacterium RIFCSPLOWO2_01_44_7]|nr:MAG: hypothetical protein A2712_06515 [Deltaproteobacteria bacterium RIFCSPHIGHO2_01_FULL_43_49]OGQ15608.1 MAG: hypothetical protein A3D22_05305 [Deltaproteobacteria bacterium RIFCSPHIGHO2_02_FULL_44_53]OGQ28311.1 MAG: hypothetical protein A3D98_00970 [Deltaproteobacteria bacterium RIFCSPHIGHO2_12_FULL_44_21]OGQ31898.1 MAG: hypothetical protein A2979_02245 [Deltaproteobacteria bacterium RIFCSPLOWO2_01_FULL_45_74]OGQ38271.1 MAG: hypothetical protein A2W61_00910 [Deltaproteobacteria bacterium 